MKALKTRAEVQAERQARIALKTAKARLRGVKKVNKGAKYPDLVNEPLRQFVRGLPCILQGLDSGDGERHECWPPVQCCHFKTKGSGGADENNVWPGCVRAHAKQEGNSAAFQARWGVNLKTICRTATSAFYREYPRSRTTRNAKPESPVAPAAPRPNQEEAR